MITGTPWAPGKAFVAAAHAMLSAIAAGDLGAALNGVDANDDGTRWSANALKASLDQYINGSVTTPAAMNKSGCPKLAVVEEENVYELRHAIPVDGRWSNSCLVLRFVRKPRSQYFHMMLAGIEKS